MTFSYWNRLTPRLFRRLRISACCADSGVLLIYFCPSHGRDAVNAIHSNNNYVYVKEAPHDILSSLIEYEYLFRTNNKRDIAGNCVLLALEFFEVSPQNSEDSATKMYCVHVDKWPLIRLLHANVRASSRITPVSSVNIAIAIECLREVGAIAVLFYLPLIYICQMGLVVGCLRMSCLCNFHSIVLVVCTHF